MDLGSRVSPLRFSTRRFPQTTPIVVSKIFLVTRSSEHTPACDNLQNKQLTKRWRRVFVGTSQMLKLDSLFFFFPKLGFFGIESHTLFRVMIFFYQRGRGSTFLGKWIIPSQIRRGRWRLSRLWRLVIPLKWKIEGRRWCISRVWRLVLPFKWTYFQNTGPRKHLSTLNSW